MSSEIQAYLIIAVFFFLVIVLPVWLFMRQSPEKRGEQDKKVSVFMNFMVGILIVTSVLQFFQGKDMHVSKTAAILSGLFIVASPWLYKFYVKRFGNLKANRVYIILLDISALITIIFYFIQKNV